jgi:hypothetical protein
MNIVYKKLNTITINLFIIILLEISIILFIKIDKYNTKTDKTSVYIFNILFCVFSIKKYKIKINNGIKKINNLLALIVDVLGLLGSNKTSTTLSFLKF